MSLSAPTQAAFIVAVIVAIVALLAMFTTAVSFLPISAFWLMTIAFVILALANLLKGL